MRSLTRLCTLALILASCGPSTPATSPSPVPSATATEASAPPSPTAAGLAALPAVTFAMRRWWLLPDGLDREGIAVRALIALDDAAPGAPRARLRSTGRTVPLARVTTKDPSLARLPPAWDGAIPLDGAKAGQDVVEVLVRLRDGRDAVAAERPVTLSAPAYVVWTLDFEGDAASDEALANTLAIATRPPGSDRIPMTILWNPRVWTTTEVSAERAEAMRAWTFARAGDDGEVGMHIHAWTDFVRAAGVTPRTAPSWSGRSDGYDVPLTAFSEDETRALVDYGVKLMKDHLLPIPTTFRGGGLFANAANLRAVAAAGFTVDTSAAPAGVFGRLPLPWTLAKDAQPYHPSRDDANAAGDLPLLEVPNIAGNTYGYTATSIQRTINDDLAMLPAAGHPATARRVLTLVSHPATIDATERAAIEALFAALGQLSYAADAGPLRFVTMSELAQALR